MVKDKNLLCKITVLLVLCFLTTTPFVYAAITSTFDTSTPAGGDDPREADDRMREIKTAVQERMNDHNSYDNEGDHYWPLTGTAVSNVDSGQHRKITFRQLVDNETDKNPINPSSLTSYSSRSKLFFMYNKRVDSDGDSDIDDTDKTELFFQDESANVMQVTRLGKLYFNSAWLLGNFFTPTDDAEDESYLSLSGGGAGAATRGGYLSLYGNDHATHPGSVYLVPGWVDETDTEDDDEDGYADGRAVIDLGGGRVSNAADPGSAQDLATKAYTDSKAGFGAWTTTGTLAAGGTESFKVTHVYEALTDGIFVVYSNTEQQGLEIYTDSSNPPTTKRIHQRPTVAETVAGVSCPVRKGDYFKLVTVTASGTPIMYWMPIGSE